MAQLPIQSLEVVGGIRSGTGSKPAYERRVLDPNPATFNAILRIDTVGSVELPIFSATPSVSVQIVASTGAAPLQVHALK
jgi:hypothetical protein